MYQVMTEQQLKQAWEEWTAGSTPPPAGPAAGPPGQPPRPGGSPPDRQRPGRAKRVAAAVTAGAALVAGGYGIRAVTDTPQTATPAAETSTPAAASNGEPAGDVSALVQQAQRSVVRVTSRLTQFGPFGQPVTGEAVGTGFVVTSDGLIVTNAHVVENGDDITVTLADGRQYLATVVQMDSAADLAVLDIDETGLPTLALADSSEVLAGQSVVAIGFALGLEGSPTVTTGIVSSTGRTIQVADGQMIRTYREVFQISAAINSGNSGGPLLDLRGRVIGINTAGAQGADNIGFAIPIDQVKALIVAAS
jgi:S1-C subfamily serine protease